MNIEELLKLKFEEPEKSQSNLEDFHSMLDEGDLSWKDAFGLLLHQTNNIGLQLLDLNNIVEKMNGELDKFYNESFVKYSDSMERINSRNFDIVDQFVIGNEKYTNAGHYNEHYKNWRIARINKVLSIFGVDYFKGKRVLELGGGHGDIGALFAGLGAEVLCLEARRENVNIAKMKYRNVSGFSCEEYNLEEGLRQFGKCDLIVNFGTLYTLLDPEKCLHECAELSENIVLECIVCDSTDPHKIVRWDLDEENHIKLANDGPISIGRHILSPFFIERVMEERGYTVGRHFTKDLNCADHHYDWEHENDGKVTPNYRRFWYFSR